MSAPGETNQGSLPRHVSFLRYSCQRILLLQVKLPLHAMAILQVHQAKVLKDLHEGRSDPETMQELQGMQDVCVSGPREASLA